MIAAAHGPSALWYATRGTGAMTLVLLTLSVVLGIGELRAWRPAGAPRFAVAALHRTVSLLAVALLAVHIVHDGARPLPAHRRAQRGRPLPDDLSAAVAGARDDRLRPAARAGADEPRAPPARLPRLARRALARLRLLARRAAARDRRGLGHEGHLDAGAHPRLRRRGRRSRSPRGSPRRRRPRPLRVGAGAVTVLAALALAIWLPQGPLAHGWARRAGTPSEVLAAFAPRRPPTPTARTRSPARSPRPSPGRVTQRDEPRRHSASPTCRMRLEGGPRGVLRLRLGGPGAPRRRAAHGPQRGDARSSPRPGALQRPRPDPARQRSCRRSSARRTAAPSASRSS